MNYQATIKEVPSCVVYSKIMTVPNYDAYFELIPAIGGIFQGSGTQGGGIGAFLAIVGTMIAYFAAVIINFGDFSRFVKDEKQKVSKVMADLAKAAGARIAGVEVHKHADDETTVAQLRESGPSEIGPLRRYNTTAAPTMSTTYRTRRPSGPVGARVP